MIIKKMDKKKDFVDLNQTKRGKTPELLIYKRKKINKENRKNYNIQSSIQPEKYENINSSINSKLSKENEEKEKINIEQKALDNKEKIYNKKLYQRNKSVDNKVVKKKWKNRNIYKDKAKVETSEININKIENNKKKEKKNYNKNEIKEKIGENEIINNLEKVHEKENEKAQIHKKLNLTKTNVDIISLSFFEKDDQKDKEKNNMEMTKKENNKKEKEKLYGKKIIINKESINITNISSENEKENSEEVYLVSDEETTINKKKDDDVNFSPFDNYSYDDDFPIIDNDVIEPRKDKDQTNIPVFEVEPIIPNQIKNNNIKGEGVVKLIKDEKSDNIKIKKNLLKEVNSLIACIGPPGSGKSTFCSNYYKSLYNVEKDYFESYDGDLTYTKGIWIISNEERRKIPIMIKKDLLDVEGFQVDDIKCWKYIMIIAFLSTDLIILNRNPRSDDVKKILRIIEKSLERMKEKHMPRILKNIYIQTLTPKPEKTIKEYIEQFIENIKVFEGINFEFLYLASISKEELLEQKDLMKFDKYKEGFNNILQRLSNSNLLKNSVSSLIDYIDFFNETLNGKTGFNEQTIYKDLETDFNGVYSRYEKKLKNELSEKIDKLIKLQSLEETFDDFINKQEGLKFVFEINNEDLTFYGSCENFDKFYEKLKEKKAFKINPKDIFWETYQTQKKLLKINIEKEAFKEEQKKIEMEMKRKRKEEKLRIQKEEKEMEKERQRRLKLQEIEKQLDEEEKRKREKQRKEEEKEERRKYLEQRNKRRLEQEKEENEIRMRMEEQKRILEEKEKINNLYNLKIKEINNYFANLKFYEYIIPKEQYNFQLNICTDQIFLKDEYENNLANHYERKIEEKKKEWQGQIERAKWKARVQACGLLKCENGCELTDEVECSTLCEGNLFCVDSDENNKCRGCLFWVDSDEKYAICNRCPENNNIQKISGDLYCTGCGAKSFATVKWITGYKP